MKLKKLKKLLPAYETVRVWGNNETVFIWEGMVKDIPLYLVNEKLIKGEEGSLLEVRYNCSGTSDHVAVFIDKEV